MGPPPPLPPQPGSQPVPPQQQKPTHCVQCGSPEFSKDTHLPVCEPCRRALVKFPFPRWVKGSAVAILVLLVISVVQLPGRWSQAVVLKRGQKMARTGNWDDAFASMRPFEKQALSVEDVDFSLNYGEAAAMSGHLSVAREILNQLVGHRITKSQIDKAHQLDRTIERTIVAAQVGHSSHVTPARPTGPELPASTTLYNKVTSP